ncbi:MAG: hypothetical protein A3J08_04380 [Candidatus Lloydbacteria bacterium RIFCSPLOWO2_02_FULL_51_11]|uniref:Uncharacterized protein n=1 Tax=Candidatus Lloydbacteria bacterium RIFCSPLOWO2_02_FULL_51_11 TaxID=1798667 RepID=A0A1G2DN20_9BACT|nr:MAG: hypothetical protein A3J08_04380 [Candidatus Lloydbacteria bacterium RIFCSPLOWO2_02_FULL_51_11]
MSARQATLISGANIQEIDLPEGAITIVGVVIARYATVMNIPDGKRRVLLNGKSVVETTTVNPGDTVEVVREAGSKG